MAVKGKLNLALHIKAEIACATPECPAEHAQQVFFDPQTTLDQLGAAIEQRSVEVVQECGWVCDGDLWYCPECSKTRAAD